MTVDDSVDFFKAVPTIREKFTTLQRVGLGYIKVGQPRDHPLRRRSAAGETCKRAFTTGNGGARSTFSMSQRQVSTTTMCENCSTSYMPWSIRAIRLSSSSTIWKSSRQLISLLIWGPKEVMGAVTSSAAERRKKSLKIETSYTGEYLAHHLGKPAPRRRERKRA